MPALPVRMATIAPNTSKIPNNTVPDSRYPINVTNIPGITTLDTCYATNLPNLTDAPNLPHVPDAPKDTTHSNSYQQQHHVPQLLNELSCHQKYGEYNEDAQYIIEETTNQPYASVITPFTGNKM